jgi:hypothetical protein
MDKLKTQNAARAVAPPYCKTKNRRPRHPAFASAFLHVSRVERLPLGPVSGVTANEVPA